MKTTEHAVVVLQKSFNVLNDDIKRFAKITRFYEQQVKERKTDPDKGAVVIKQMKNRIDEAISKLTSLAQAMETLVYGSYPNVNISENTPEDIEKMLSNRAILTGLELNVGP